MVIHSPLLSDHTIKGDGDAADTHYSPFKDLSLPINTTGNLVVAQKHDFTCQRCGMEDSYRVPMPAPFTIRHECKKDDKNKYFVETKKEGSGGPLTSIKEYVSPPEIPTNLQIIEVPETGGDILLKFKWNDNSDIERDFAIGYYGAGNSLVEITMPANSIEYTTVKKFKKTDLNGQTMTFSISARGYLVNSELAFISKEFNYDK